MSALPPSTPPHAVWLVLPEITEAIERALRQRGMRGADVEDERQEVLRAALVVREPPVSYAQCLVLVRKIASDRAIDQIRRKHRRERLDVGPCDDADDRPARGNGGDDGDRIDVRRQLDVVLRSIESGYVTARQAVILESALDGTPHQEIAQQLNLTRKTVTNDLAGARRTVRASWAAFAAVGVVAAIAFLFWQPEPEITAPNLQTPEERAQELRTEALRDCEAAQWKKCVHDLDEAAAMDPAGDTDPRVLKARQDAAEHLGVSPAPSTSARP
jgi:DNA-directed RNA polymerase specialized sigma24 family protein